MALIYLGIGSNCDRENNISLALKSLRQRFGEVERSSVVQSPATNGVGEDYYNLVVAFVADVSTEELRRRCKELEAELDRDRSAPNQISIDLDILLYDDCCAGFDTFQIPHPDTADQLHVIQPLAELAPHTKHPTLNLTFLELLERFDQRLQTVDY